MKEAIIIIPTYNEKGNIERMIAMLEKEVFPSITNWEMGILVADDSSPDGTGDIIKELMKTYKNLHLNVGEKQGLGAAYIRAMKYAIEKLGATVVFEMDADFFHDPKKIPDFLKKIDEGYDFVIGTRYSGGGSIPSNWALNRKLLSIVGNFVVRVVFTRFSIHDWTGGYRAIKKEVFLKEKEKLAPFRGYRFQVGFLYTAVQDGFKVAEVPFHATDRTEGRSKMARSDTVIDTLKFVFYARFLELQRFIKFLIVGGTGFIVQLIAQEVSIRSGFTLFLAKASSTFISQFTYHSDISSLSQGYGAAIGAESAILSNFLFNNIWTFKDRTGQNMNGNGLFRLIKFNLASFASIIIQFFAVWLGVKILGTETQIVGFTIPVRILIVIPTIIFIVIPLNYIIYNKIIWRTHNAKNETHPQK